MEMPDRCVTDTNIWIDLNSGGLLHSVFNLEITMLAPDAIVRELDKPPWSALKQMGVQRCVLSGEHVQEVYILRQAHPRISVPDLMALVLAKHENAPLLTGDKSLRQIAKATGLECRGTLWLLDVLYNKGIKTAFECREALTVMLKSGRRLPLQECKKRLAKWSLQVG